MIMSYPKTENSASLATEFWKVTHNYSLMCLVEQTTNEPRDASSAIHCILLITQWLWRSENSTDFLDIITSSEGAKAQASQLCEGK